MNNPFLVCKCIYLALKQDALLESEKPFSSDPARQARFEQFLKDKYKGGLRSANVAPTSTMSEADRARERLDFEAAAEAIEKGKGEKVVDPSSLFSLPGMNGQRFVAATQVEVYTVVVVIILSFLPNVILSFLPNVDPWKFF